MPLNTMLDNDLAIVAEKRIHVTRIALDVPRYFELDGGIGDAGGRTGDRSAAAGDRRGLRIERGECPSMRRSGGEGVMMRDTSVARREPRVSFAVLVDTKPRNPKPPGLPVFDSGSRSPPATMGKHRKSKSGVEGGVQDAGLRAAPAASPEPKKKKKQKDSEIVAAGGEAGLQEVGFEAAPAASPELKKKGKKRKDSEIANESVHVVPDAVHEPGSEYDVTEPTMAEKLASINLVGDGKPEDTTRKEPSPPPAPPSADSVHVLLKQALHADDHSLLLECLFTRDEKVIAKSTALLNPADVLKLLKSLVSMLQSRGAVMICTLPWLRSLLSQHASSIVSQESSLLLLNSLYQLIESRNSTFGSALQLSTCLDYLFAGIPDDEADEETAPFIVYEDKDSDEESEDAMETDEDGEELGSVIDSPQRPLESDEDEAMSD